MPDRAAILISCRKEEAEKIRELAALDHRSVSSYLLKILMPWVDFEDRLFVELTRYRQLERKVWFRRFALPKGPRTTIFLRCSREESQRIRNAAERRGTSISAFIRECLRRSWTAREAHGQPLLLRPRAKSDRFE